MELYGRELYDEYVRAMLDQSIEVDAWDQLTDADRKAWDAVASYAANACHCPEG